MSNALLSGNKKQQNTQTNKHTFAGRLASKWRTSPYSSTHLPGRGSTILLFQPLRDSKRMPHKHTMDAPFLVHPSLSHVLYYFQAVRPNSCHTLNGLWAVLLNCFSVLGGPQAICLSSCGWSLGHPNDQLLAVAVRQLGLLTVGLKHRHELEKPMPQRMTTSWDRILELQQNLQMAVGSISLSSGMSQVWLVVQTQEMLGNLVEHRDGNTDSELACVSWRPVEMGEMNIFC